VPRIRYLASTPAGNARPDRSWYLQWFADVFPTAVTADLAKARTGNARSFLYLVREGCEGAKDPDMRSWCTVMAAEFVPMLNEWGTVVGGFDWSAIGAAGELVRQGLYRWDYDKHHVKTYTDFNQVSHGPAGLLAIVYRQQMWPCSVDVPCQLPAPAYTRACLN
jgi:hypothetical protein